MISDDVSGEVRECPACKDIHEIVVYDGEHPFTDPPRFCPSLQVSYAVMENGQVYYGSSCDEIDQES